jgi:hypothetical protein
MESEKGSGDKIKNDSVKEVFDELVPKPWALRFFISVIFYSILFQVLKFYDVKIIIWVISLVVTAIFNIIVWNVLREYQFSRFQKNST